MLDITRTRALESIPESCGDVAVGCSDVAGLIQSVIDSSEELRGEHTALNRTVEELRADQGKVSEACDEARLLSERAIDRLGEGTSLIQSSLGKIGDLLELVEALTSHVTGFAAAMDQVRSSSQEIDRIAETTNILALNANIEAMRAGDAGRTFAVVANEVKSLATETRKATEEIGRTIDALSAEADEVVERIEQGAEASSTAKSSVASIDETMNTVIAIVNDVDVQNDQIARSTSTISDHVNRVGSVLTNFADAASQNESHLGEAHQRMDALELTACEMFDRIVKAGLSPDDLQMAQASQDAAQRAAELASEALASGALGEAALFDDDYRLIEGSRPPRYRTGLMDWADAHWRSILDDVKALDDRILAAVCVDQNGYLPTHMSETSRQPNGDLAHDTRFSRNGRRFELPINRKAARSTDDYMMSVYRHEGDGQGYSVVRSAYAPIHIGGRKWGNFQITYRA